MPRRSTTPRRTRRWTFTLNNFVPGDVIRLREIGRSIGEDEAQAKYVIFGRERGESGTRHLQGYIELVNPKPLGGLRRLISRRAHFEQARGTPTQASTYCKKEEDFEEFGTISRQGRRTDLEEIKELIETGATEREIAEQHFSKWCVYRRSFRAYKELLTPQSRDDVDVTVIWGFTGAGKTRFVYEALGEADGSPKLWCNSDGELKWFDGYHGEQWVLLDDFRGSAPFEWLLRILDRYPLSVPVKGSFATWRPTRIWITSNLPPEAWYPDLDCAPLLRRINRIVHLDDGLSSEDDWPTRKELINSKLAENNKNSWQ